MVDRLTPHILVLVPETFVEILIFAISVPPIVLVMRGNLPCTHLEGECSPLGDNFQF